jgi:hypothetical protein
MRLDEASMYEGSGRIRSDLVFLRIVGAPTGLNPCYRRERAFRGPSFSHLLPGPIEAGSKSRFLF